MIRVGATVTWPSREDVHMSDWHNLQAVFLAKTPCYGNTFTNSDGSKLAALH